MSVEVLCYWSFAVGFFAGGVFVAILSVLLGRRANVPRCKCDTPRRRDRAWIRRATDVRFNDTSVSVDSDEETTKD